MFGGFAARWMVIFAANAAVAVLTVLLFLSLCRVHPILGGFLSAHSVLVSLCGSFLNLVARRGLFVMASPSYIPPAKVQLVDWLWLPLVFSIWFLPMFCGSRVSWWGFALNAV